MKVRILYPFLLLLFLGVGKMVAQTTNPEIERLEAEIQQLEAKKAELAQKVEKEKLNIAGAELRKYGLPSLESGEEVIHHKALSLVYSEKHEQARWVAHIILPEVTSGTVTRTNDFRPDPLVKTGSTVEEDYFLKYPKEDGEFEYDGFGYDRGHLAPSADFRWSATALSESYFYSNMSPQAPDFNRGAWADLEADIRGYISRNPGSRLFVVTGPVLQDDLPHIERGMNKVSIPYEYFKVVVDLEKQLGIGFLLPNKEITDDLMKYGVSIDAVERKTGIDFFAALPEDVETKVEAQTDLKPWLPDVASGDVEPLHPPDLPRNHFNTRQAKVYMERNEKVTICGTVVSGRTSRKGNVLLNFDKRYPNQIFTVFVREQYIPNFSYNIETRYLNEQVCATGKIISLGGDPAMFIENEKQLQLFIDK